MYSRVYASIDLDAIHDNMEQMHQMLQEGTKVIAVVKTDAYGHGAVEIAKELEPLDYVFGYAVATAEEGKNLIRNGIKKPILILGISFEEQYMEIIENQIRPAICSYEMAKELNAYCERCNKTLPIHIAVDTGMSRIGFQVTEKDADEIKKISSLSNLKIEGMFTHFAKADEKDKTGARQQYARFGQMLDYMKEREIKIPIRHCSNSASILELRDMNLDVVRAGITLYGMWPSPEVNRACFRPAPVLSLYSKIVFIKELEDGREVSYGGTYVTSGTRKIATIPVGYGDGYARGLSNKGSVLIRGKRAPIVGRVCMDQFMVDITEIEGASVGDKVTLIGRDQEEEITMEEVGELSGRFNYEFVCDLGKRIPRVFVKNGEVTGTKDYFNE